MSMREECKHFQSRTYASGEVARWCELDLAPEAPWRCPPDCASFAPRLADVAWEHGSLVQPAVEPEPEVPADDAVELLNAAEDVVNAAVPETLREISEEREAKREPWWRRRRHGG